MSPRTPDVANLTPGFPRVSGDEPFGLIPATDVDVFSPRERG